MEEQSTKMKQKIKDYSRFLITLLILSVYFYLGMIINTFLVPSEQSGLLIILMLSSLSFAGLFAFLISKWNKQLKQLIEQ
ncbi:YrhC family protein [Aquibacillus sediminis]|uniref:YrhC family protein n=1 Tax=Aquibacillus sediminis TaxID=2574734 RepID=UPI0014869FEC|nr:YrhC family protein [Aquibacillus sediminis]